MTDRQEQQRIDYLRGAKAQNTLDRLEREDPTRWYHYLKFAFWGLCIVALPVIILSFFF